MSFLKTMIAFSLTISMDTIVGFSVIRPKNQSSPILKN